MGRTPGAPAQGGACTPPVRAAGDWWSVRPARRALRSPGSGSAEAKGKGAGARSACNPGLRCCGCPGRPFASGDRVERPIEFPVRPDCCRSRSRALAAAPSCTFLCTSLAISGGCRRCGNQAFEKSGDGSAPSLRIGKPANRHVVVSTRAARRRWFSVPARDGGVSFRDRGDVSGGEARLLSRTSRDGRPRHRASRPEHGSWRRPDHGHPGGPRRRPGRRTCPA